MYAICPTCNYSWKPSYDHISATAIYPTECTNRIAGHSESTTCNTRLLVERNGHLRPIKPFLAASFADYLARSLSDAQIERLGDKACDDALDALNDPTNAMNNIFHAKFMKNFEGPVPGQLFIDRGDKVRLAFAIQTDFFNPNGTRKRGNHDSIGIISLVNLNLPENIRLQPEHVFLAGIIPGPREPEKEEISHFLRPVVDECLDSWERGLHISKTASCPDTGRDVEVAIVISVNDLPAARKVSGTAPGHGSDFYCTVCNCYGRATMYNSDFDQWKPRDVAEMRQQAEAWRDAQTSKERDEIFAEHGVQWSEFWRLPYWNPSRMLVIDSMHCILEGLVHYHCRYVLELDLKQAKASYSVVPAFSHPWSQYSPDVPLEYRVKHDREMRQISELHDILVLPIGSDLGSITVDELRVKLMSKNLTPLKFVCFSLGLRMEVLCKQNHIIAAKSKKHFSDLLISWVSYIFQFCI